MTTPKPMLAPGPASHFGLTALVALILLFSDTELSLTAAAPAVAPAARVLPPAPVPPPTCSFSVVSCLVDFLLLLVVTETLYIRCIRMDPGFVQQKGGKWLPALRQRSAEPTDSRPSSWLHPPVSDPEAGGDEELILPVIVCALCRVQVPVRCRHCYECGRCVSRFDHHCPWVGQCVGRGNHRVFWAFLLAQAALLAVCIKSFWFSFGPLSVESSTEAWLWRYKLLVFGFLVCVLAFTLAAGLLWFHSFLMITDTTTWEFVKARRLKYREPFSFVSPFSRGVARNVRRFLLPPPAGADFATLDEEDTKQWWRAYERLQARRRMREARQRQTQEQQQQCPAELKADAVPV